MRCRDARAALLERELGGLDAIRRETLTRHLELCRDCAAEAAIEAKLAADLATLRHEPVPWVDVRPAVAARIAAAAPGRREEVSTGQVAAAAAAAAVFLPLLLAGLWAALPGTGAISSGLGGAASLLADLAGGLAVAFASLLALPVQMIEFLARATQSLGPVASRLQPVGIVAGSIACAAMAVTTTIVVGRDLTRDRALIPREEQG